MLDANGASFVSVTQAFNTTTSMGRLTLNVLLSFAQFEREVTGERIRDKIAASKKKGIWMGGTVPLGYDVRDRRLVVNPAEAEMVRHIFGRYLELGSVRDVVTLLGMEGWRTKIQIRASGPHRGGVGRLVGLVAEAHAVRRAVLEQTGSLAQIATRLGKCRGHLADMMRISYLAPDIVDAIVAGRQPASLKRKTLMASQLSLDWAEQRRQLGFA